ncbi:hypothetical protein ANOM_008083 [Aspergillus nomiae NRRL 13137]|uniref:Serine protein kinase n=1 Tax=Aspergillus nomiae NRRL (strain ATCC 15546 / NRRL 13137 / CBS 260.88 / M93) TaxID=1509407 RepID=A0A0L1J0D4_ASPN3|nr:uncharacterized protein ANOM_008083 [Aspergillus nomiae NRRL 13137]KNG85207.1 hypothetical protein ANOM_008083 [Aspergillus nomiae NRRL 13137]
MSEQKIYPNDDHFLFRKNDTTLILDTTEKYVIGKDFEFCTTTCLIYAEVVEITSKLEIPGKKLGLFCSKILIPEHVKVDVSGKNGKVGDPKTSEDGGAGQPGGDAGSVWIFVQDFNSKDFEKLELNARGGNGGHGGKTVASGKTGGKGGNGGKGGLIEVVIGTTPVDAIVALRNIDRLHWPEKVASLLEPAVPDVVAGFITEEQKGTLAQYQSLAQMIRKLAQALRGIPESDQSANVKDSVSQLLGQIEKTLESVTEAPPLSQTTFETLEDAITGLDDSSNLAQALEAVKERIQALSPTKNSPLCSLLDDIWDALESEKLAIRNAIEPKLKSNRGGAGGPGGHSGPGLQPGPGGAEGVEGETNLRFLELNGSKKDLQVSQAYIFPEQCQMLLNKADSQFFSQEWKARGPAVEQYEQLIRRLNVVQTLATDGKADKSSGFWAAISGLEETLKVTRNSAGQLKAIHGQAKSRLNRLILGQDMFGHGHTWVPRLSFDYYARTLEDQLNVLKEIEDLESKYRDAFQKDAVTETLIDAGIDKMGYAAQEAKNKIALLTGSNEKHQKIKEEVVRLQLKCDLDIFEGLCTLTSLKKDLRSLKKLYDLYREALTDVKDQNGKLFNKEYVMGQITECTDSLESLKSALRTAKDNTIALDDPKALKVMAKKEDIEKLMQKFANAIEEGSRKKIQGALDAYIATILQRNEAVVDYNSFIHLLFEARHDEEYARAQAMSMADKKLDLDPTIPAVSLWLRKTRDNFQLQLMQRLDFASRAVKFWGLKKDLEQSEPGPLRNSQKLKLDRVDLDNAFENILNRYAGDVRSVWPGSLDEQGLFYDLTESELVELTTGQKENGQPEMVYKVSLNFAPGDSPFGAGRADVRLEEVRFWLVGASVRPDGLGRQRILVHIEHLGPEVFEDDNHDRLEFSHDMLTIPFEYDAARVSSTKDLTSRAMLSQQNALRGSWTGGLKREEAGSIAAVGPFATWRLVVRESENPELDMSKVASAHVEFRGANRSFKYTSVATS